MKKTGYLAAASILINCLVCGSLFSTDIFDISDMKNKNYIFCDYSAARVDWGDFERINDHLEYLTQGAFTAKRLGSDTGLIGVSAGYTAGKLGIEFGYRQMLNALEAENHFNGARGRSRVFYSSMELGVSFPRGDVTALEGRGRPFFKKFSFWGGLSASLNTFKWELYNPNMRFRNGAGDPRPAAAGSEYLFFDDEEGAVFYTGTDSGINTLSASVTSIGFTPSLNVSMKLSGDVALWGSASTVYVVPTKAVSSGGYYIPLPDKLRTAGSPSSVNRSARDTETDTRLDLLSVKLCYYFK
ncbi:MAG: hypothetical protein JW803_02550 [Endomicrobiales bacterium]|nr:hypothetical protein [Endomicrobiales bacterium]